MGEQLGVNLQSNTGSMNTDSNNTTNDDKSMSNTDTDNTDNNSFAGIDEEQIILDGIVKDGLRKSEAEDETRSGTPGKGGRPTILAVGASVAEITDELFTDALDSAQALADKQAEVSESKGENKSKRGATPGDTILVQAEYQLASSMSTAGAEITKTTGTAARGGSKTS